MLNISHDFAAQIDFRIDINTEAQVKPTIFLFQSTIKTTTLFRQKETSHKTWLVFLYNREVFFFSLSYMHCRFTKQCYFNVVGHFICLVCHLRFLCDIITMSSISQFHVFCMRFQSQGQLKVILLLRGKRCTWNCHNHYYSTFS